MLEQYPLGLRRVLRVVECSEVLVSFVGSVPRSSPTTSTFTSPVTTEDRPRVGEKDRPIVG